MIFSALFEHPYKLVALIGITFLIILLLTFIFIYLYINRIRRKKQSDEAIAKKRLIYSSPTSIRPQLPTKATNRFVFPLPKVENVETSTKTTNETLTAYPLSEIPSNYKTFQIGKRFQRHLSSDSSYTSTAQRLSQSPSTFSFDPVKSKIQQVQRRSNPSPLLARRLETIHSEQNPKNLSSDSDDQDDQSMTTPVTPSFEYSLADLFCFELVYKVYYLLDDSQLIFQLIRLTSMQPLIDRCFPSIICKIRLCTSNDKRKNKKYFSKRNPINEIFKFDIDQYALEQSYLKVHVLGQHKNDKRLELGHIALVLNQYNNLMVRTGHYHDGGLEASEIHTKSITIYDDRIEMLTQQQITSENEARALICLVYENDRCLLQVGLIKIINIEQLRKLSPGNSQHRDIFQIKICRIIDGKILEKKKSKPTLMQKNALTFSTTFHLDYLSLHKTSIRITICYRKTLITSQNKPISFIEFGSTNLKNQQTFQHWTDTISAPNRPHVHWHTLQSIDDNNHK